jgi:integrase
MAILIKRGNVYYSDLRFGEKRIRRALSTDKREAEKRLADLVKERYANRHGHAVLDIEWEPFKERFLHHAKTKATDTYMAYKRAVRHMESFRYPQKLSNITPGFLFELQTAWKHEERGLYVTNRDIQALKTMMRLGESWGLIQKQEWGLVKKDKEPRGRLRFFTVEELQKILAVCDDNWKAFVLLGSRAGLRPSEIRWLTWADVDFERNRVHIVGKDSWQPKDYEQRWIPMKDDLKAHLKSLSRESKWVIHHSGEKLSDWVAWYYFHEIVEKAGIVKPTKDNPNKFEADGSAYTLRHTFASHLAIEGVPLKHIAELMGHASTKVTEIYAHLLPDTRDKAIDRLPPLEPKLDTLPTVA